MAENATPLLPHGGYEHLRSHKVAEAVCPTCSAPMRLRHARKGPRAGGTFWGCTNYPECDGLRDAAPDRPPS